MNTLTVSNSKKTTLSRPRKKEVKHLKLKAVILDRFLEIIEDECLGRLMEDMEKEKNIPLAKAGKIMK